MVGLIWVIHSHGPIPESRIVINVIFYMFGIYLTLDTYLEVRLGDRGGPRSWLNWGCPLQQGPSLGYVKLATELYVHGLLGAHKVMSSGVSFKGV